jgi:hypothetical protein
MTEQNFNKRIQIILEGLTNLAESQDIELEIDNTFDDDERSSLSCMVHRADVNRYIIISTDVEDYPDDLVCFFIFNPKLYSYAKMEGFDLPGTLEGFENQVFKKCTMKECFDHMLKDGD